jgi:hypothetical protein
MKVNSKTTKVKDKRHKYYLLWRLIVKLQGLRMKDLLYR